MRVASVAALTMLTYRSPTFQLPGCGLAFGTQKGHEATACFLLHSQDSNSVNFGTAKQGSPGNVFDWVFSAVTKGRNISFLFLGPPEGLKV